ncbi:MAG: TIGR03086 family metal-binding protein [Acidimicrobiia bacterium]
MDTLDALDRGFASTRTVVAQVRPEHLSLPTPCSEWDVRALLTHTIGVIDGFQATAAKLPSAGTDARPDVSDDPLGAYDKAASATLAAWREPGALDGETTLPIGFPVPAQVAAGINYCDCVVHGWDLRRALGVDSELEPELAEQALAVVSTVVTPDVRGAGAFGPEVPVAADASPTARLVGFLGRQP